MCNTPLERCCQDLSNGIIQAPKFLKFQLVKPKTICSCLVIAEHAGQKNCNGKMTTGFFHNVSYECIEGKLEIFLLVVMSIGDDWMLDLMIIYIKKTIAKALDINDIINFFTGISTR